MSCLEQTTTYIHLANAMRLLKTVRLFWTFYSSFFFLSLVINACCIGMLLQYGLGIFTAIFWLKLATLFLTFFFINSYKAKEYYYYMNAGLSRRKLWGVTIAFDMTLFIFLIIYSYHLK